MKAKDIVYHYSIRIDFNADKVTQKQNKHVVLGVNSEMLVIDDYRFTTIKHKKSYRGDSDSLFNQVAVFDTSNWRISSSDYIESDLYTSSSSTKIAYRRMKKALETFIYKKHGRYCNAILFLDQIKI
jgi:hypothetical protein